MPIQVIALVTINENAAIELAAYMALTTPLLANANAKITHRFNVAETVIGRQPAKCVIIVEYPNREALGQVFDSEDYAKATVFRDIAFLEYHVSIVENEMVSS
jgi:uncharacterized protein (DUF1330 family)